MWFSNPQKINNISQKQIPIEQPKCNTPGPAPIYQTPIKQSLNIQRNNDTPVQFDLNFYFGNLWSSGHIPGHNIEIIVLHKIIDKQICYCLNHRWKNRDIN